MRADKSALVALDADVGIPDGDLHSDVALLETGRPGGIRAIGRHGRNRQAVALAGDHRGGHVAHELGCAFRHRRADVQAALRPIGQRQTVDALLRQFGRLDVAFDDRRPLVAVGIFHRQTDVLQRLVFRQHAGDGEEGRLHDDVDASTQAERLRQRIGVDDVDLGLLLDECMLYFQRYLGPGLVRRMGAVEQERAPRLQVMENVVALQESEGMAGDELGLIDQVRAADRRRAESQVRSRHRPGFLRVINEVALGEVVGGLADDLDRVLVGADRSIRTQAIEQGPPHAFRFTVEVVIPRQARPADVVENADGEMVLRAGFGQVIEHGLGHPGVELLRPQAVAPADHLREGALPQPGGNRFGQRRLHVLVERLPGRSRFLRAVEHTQGAHARRQGFHERADVERPEETDPNQPNLLPAPDQQIDDLVHRLGAGAHHHHDALGVRRADVIEQVVGPADPGGEPIHRRLDDLRSPGVVRIDRLPALEVHIGILR